MSDNYTADSEKFEIVHKMSRRIASVDKYCVVTTALFAATIPLGASS